MRSSKHSRRRPTHIRTKKLAFEGLEDRRLLAGDLVAELTQGELTITGDRSANGLRISTVEKTVEDTQMVRGGTTSVYLDLELLQSAANLELSSVDSDGTPYSSDFQVGFPIEPSSDFQFSTSNGFELIGGTIDHTGTVGFNEDAIIVGDFVIGFDASRAVGDASGFFVEDTVGGLGVMFDLSAPGEVAFDDPKLTIADTDLLVSPELAAILLQLGLASGDLTGADVGDARVDAVTDDYLLRRVDDGVTSVYLDTELLAAAASLEVSSITSDGQPYSSDYQVGFPIDRYSTFALGATSGRLDPLGGVIKHTGTVGFNGDSIIVGDFEIGYDPARATGDASGFYVEDTVAGLGILFDISVPGLVDFSDPELTVVDADLLVSPEFGALLDQLGLSDGNLQGADVGDARIDAEVTQLTEKFVALEGLFNQGATKINGERRVEYPAELVDNIAIYGKGNSDWIKVDSFYFPGNIFADYDRGFFNRMEIQRSHLPGVVEIDGSTRTERIQVSSSEIGALKADLSSGTDLVSIYNSELNDLYVRSASSGLFQQVIVSRSMVHSADVSLNGYWTSTTISYSTLGDVSINTGNGSDSVFVMSSTITGDANVQLNGGWDRLRFFRSQVQGDAYFDGGSGWLDSFDSFYSRYGSLQKRNFEIGFVR